MNVVKEIQRINQREMGNGSWSDSSSWHAEYKNSAWIFVGNLDYDLSEGDVVCIFSQFGEISHVELIRDHKTGKSKGFGFLQYEDQRSTILAVDNLGGATVLGRTLRVDHSHTGPRDPKKKKKEGEEESSEEEEDKPKMNVAPQLIEVKEEKKPKRKPKELLELDDEDPMAAYFRDKHEKKHKSSHKKKKDKSKDDRRDRHRDEDGKSRHRDDSRDKERHSRHRDDSRDDERREDERRSRYRDDSRDRYRDEGRKRHRDDSRDKRYRDDSGDRSKRRRTPLH